MKTRIEQVRSTLADILKPEQVPEIKESEGRITVSVVTDVPMGQKPGFAEEVKRRVGTLDGVKEVFVAFQAPAQADAPQGPAPLEGVKRILAVGSGKGGVGKSTVAVNLAAALVRKGLKIGLLDADIHGPSAAIMTGTRNHRAAADEQRRVIPANAHGLKVISIAFLTPPGQQAVVWRGPLVGRMVTQLLTNVAWGELDLLVVDLPPGTGDAVLSLAQTVPLSGALVVTTPQDVALLDVEKAVEMFQSVRVPVTGVIENMAGFVCPECGHETHIFLQGAGEKAAKKFNLPLLGSFPIDTSITPSGDEGTPIVFSQPDGAPAKAFAACADKMMARLDELASASAGTVNLTWDA
ncbi:MAG: Mrp/NBP35 family ATP-binding protein [Planctomycetota bacterium]|nr:Mrp/NBP35 family ATP-binding protein [Planctomycetota bacterium]